MNNPSRFSLFQQHLSGFTLLELMIVLAIVGIMVALAGPSFQSSIQNSNIASARDALANGVKMTRGEALYTKTPSTLCASTDQSACSGGSDWEQGWIVFSDFDGDGSLDAGDGDSVIDVNYGFNTNAIDVGVDGSGGAFTFDANGIRTTAGQWTVSFCDKDTGTTCRSFQVSTVGGIRYQ